MSETWHTPITWTYNQLVDQTDMNEQIRDNMTYVKAVAEDATIGAILDGGGADISTNTTYEIQVPCDATTLWASVRTNESVDSGDEITIDVRRLANSDADNAFTSDDEIITGLGLSTDTGRYNFQTASTDWVTTLTQYDWLQFKVVTCSGITKCTVQLGIHKEA